MENIDTLKADIEELEHEHHHHHEHGEECTCSCHGHHEHHHEHHEHEEHCDCHKHHHEHSEECTCGCHDHEHHHEHGEDCSCGCHDHEHEHHHHHHADEVFSSWGKETVRTYTENEIRNILAELDSIAYGVILRAKGIVKGSEGWIHFDYVPGEADVRLGSSSTIGRICVIGSKINEEKIAELFKA